MAVTETMSPPGGSVATGARVGAKPWTVVILLSLLCAISFVDRMILALLIDPIRAEFGVSDTQVALLYGLGFVIFYGFAGIPIAHAADRGNRARLIVAGVTLWSLMTLAAGFATSFPMLVATRAGVAVGEAVLTPLAISLIADLFPSERRAMPTSVYLAVGAVMSSGSLIVGGGAVALAHALSDPLGIEPWRITMALVAIPGLLCGILFALIVREPERREGAVSKDQESFMAALRHYATNAGIYLAMAIGIGLMLMVKFGIVAWAPTMLIREYGMSAAAAGATIGSGALAGGVMGTMSVPFVLPYLHRSSRMIAIGRAALIYAAVTMPVLALTIATGSVPLIIFGIMVGVTGLAALVVLPSVLVQEMTPPRFRARVMAICLLIINLLALGLGPVAVTLIANWNKAAGLGGAMSTMGWVILLPALGCFTLVLMTLNRKNAATADMV